MVLSTLRIFLQQEIKKQNANMSAFSQKANINRGVLSATLREHSSKPLSFSLFQKIVQTLNCDEKLALGYYIEECFHSGKPNRGRVEPFLMRCGELGLVPYIQETIARLSDSHSDLLTIMFDVGEKLYSSGFNKNSILFHEALIKYDNSRRSEELAISHYRVFRARISEQNEGNLINTTKFLPFYEELPHHIQMDAALKIINVYFALNDIKEASYWVEELSSLVQYFYRCAEQSDWNKLPTETEFPFVVYYGYVCLSQETFMFMEERFIEARPYNEKYKDLSWFPKLDEAGKREVERFKFCARMNTAYTELALGNEEMLLECIDIIETNPDELLVVLLFILDFAMKFDHDIDTFLQSYSERIEAHPYANSIYNRNPSIVWNRYTNVCIDTALYYFKRGHYEKAIEHAQRGINTPIGINTDKFFFARLAPIFEKFPILIHPN